MFKRAFERDFPKEEKNVTAGINLAFVDAAAPEKVLNKPAPTETGTTLIAKKTAQTIHLLKLFECIANLAYSSTFKDASDYTMRAIPPGHIFNFLATK